MSYLKYLLTALTLLVMSVVIAQNGISVSGLRCESKVNPLGVAGKSPDFSWIISSSQRNVKQSSYHILVADTPEKLGNDTGNCWDSQVVHSQQSNRVGFAGSTLKADTKYYWKVKITDQFGHKSEWSDPAWFHTGLSDLSDWGEARWIGYENLPDSMKIFPGIHGSGDKLGNRGVKRSTVPYYRKEFGISKKIRSATLFISGLGHYEAKVNGKVAGNHFLSPGWTDYNKTCLYNCYDVTNVLKQGKNVLGVIVGNGFYNVNRERYRKLVIAYGYPKVISKLKITFEDGTTSDISSGTDWKCTPSPIVYTGIYGGEDYDATLEQPGWDQPGFDDSGWQNALLATIPTGRLTAESDYPVTINRSIPVAQILKCNTGKYLYDFGQNGSGIIELKVSGKRGSVIKLTPGELITTGKEINQKASGSPYYFTYTLKGDGVEVWRPKFSYYGFRYVMVEGAVPESDKAGSDLPGILNLEMLHTCNSSPKNGEFACSNELFNKIYNLIDWAARSNLQSVVTDCPHREKLGWLEQTYLMGASLHYNYDLYALYRKAVRDMIDAQAPDGLVPDIAPEYTQFQGGFRDSPEWGSAAVILPWMLWEWYGDIAMVREAMPMMQKYVAYLGTKTSGSLLSHGLGDWFDYGPKSPGEAQLTPKTLTATSIYFYDLQLLSRMMKLCEMNAEAKNVEILAARVKNAFNQKFFNPQDKVYSTGSQTAMAMPLCVGLVDENDRKEVVKNLVSSIVKSGYTLTAGDVGFHFLVKALEENGCSQLLFDMNFRNDLPGYGFQLKKGATALTESWPALEEVSNNHLMLGHLMEWFYTGLGGIKQANNSTAFSNFVIRPEIVGDLTEVKTSYLSPYGKIRSEWKKTNNSLEMTIEIPVNTEAVIVFPVGSGSGVTENGKQVVLTSTAEGKFCLRTGSGSYIFRMRYP